MTVSVSPLERASEKRYPAWTLYARALTGNSRDAESLVRRAVRETSRNRASEAEAHADVLQAIRQQALDKERPAPSVLTQLKDDLEATTLRVHRRLRFLPKLERRAIRMVVLARPAKSVPEAARRLRVSEEKLTDVLEAALMELSAAGHGGFHREHVVFAELNGFVSGALSGDEARAVKSHASECSFCGNRLGTMMLLKSHTAAQARIPWLNRGQRRTGGALVAMLALALCGFAADALWPNPWAAHATEETVPQWFHDFFYGNDRGLDPSGASTGLAHIVRGELDQAIEVLSPLARGPESTPELRAYLGIARYLDGDSSRRTVRLLEEGTRSNRAGRLSRWYLASTLLTRRDVDGARSELKALASTSDWFGRAAEQLLEALDDASKDDIAA